MLGGNRRREGCELLKKALGVLSDQNDLVVQAIHIPAELDNLCIPDSELPFIPMSLPSLSWSYHNDSAMPSNFMYTKPFLFNPNLELDSSYKCSLEAVILFNIALVYHTAAVHSHDAFEATALALYENCLELLDQDDIEDLSYIRIAALNNKVQIHHGRAEMIAAAFFLDQMREILMETLHRTDAEYFDDQDANGLLLNIACQRVLVCAPGA